MAILAILEILEDSLAIFGFNFQDFRRTGSRNHAMKRFVIC